MRPADAVNLITELLETIDFEGGHQDRVDILQAARIEAEGLYGVSTSDDHGDEWYYDQRTEIDDEDIEQCIDTLVEELEIVR